MKAKWLASLLGLLAAACGKKTDTREADGPESVNPVGGRYTPGRPEGGPPAGTWKGTVGGRVTGSDEGTPVDGPMEQELLIGFDDAGRILYAAGRSGLVAVTAAGQTIRYLDGQGQLTTATVKDVAVTPSGGRLVVALHAEYNQNFDAGSVTRSSAGSWACTLTRQGDGMRAVLEFDYSSRSAATFGGDTRFGQGYAAGTLQGVLRRQ